MYVKVSKAGADLASSLEEAHDFHSLSIEAPAAVSRPSVVSTLLADGWATGESDDGVWLDKSALENAVSASDPNSTDNFHAMIGYAVSHGWLSNDGSGIAAHIRWVSDAPPPTDSDHFRRVLSSFATGVAVITAIGKDGTPVGMAVGSFTSVSLDPPLVAFLPAKTSTSFPRIAEAPSYCVNILGSDQESVCRRFARSGSDKFAGVDWHPAPSGAPILDDAVAWIDCKHHSTADGGDHVIEIGTVTALDVQSDDSPLIFFNGGYGDFTTRSIVAVEPSQSQSNRSVIDQIRITTAIRSDLEELADSLGVQVVAVGADPKHTVVLASSRVGGSTETRLARVGYRMPLVAPVGGLFVAWSSNDAIEAWKSSASRGNKSELDRILNALRRRGWSLTLASSTHRQLEAAVGQDTVDRLAHPRDEELRLLAAAVLDDYEPTLNEASTSRWDVAMISAPVFDAQGEVILTLGLWSFPLGLELKGVKDSTTALVACADSVTARLGGTDPRGLEPPLAVVI